MDLSLRVDLPEYFLHQQLRNGMIMTINRKALRLRGVDGGRD